VAERTEDAILFEEIDDELRQDKANKLWRFYGKYIVASFVTIVLCVGVYQAWKNHDLKNRQNAGESFATAITLAADNRTEDSYNALSNIIESGTDGYKVLARFSQARLMAQKDNVSGAVIAYHALAEDKSLDILYRDLAVILGVLIELNIAGSDMKMLKDKLRKLTNDNNPWRFSAREISAIIDQKTGLNIEALKVLRDLGNDKLVPKGIRARANELLSVMSK
jgi:hypothetical protein